RAISGSRPTPPPRGSRQLGARRRASRDTLGRPSPTSITASSEGTDPGVSLAGASVWPEAMGTPRERIEEIERRTLSERAVLSSETKGRERDEEPHPLRTAFQRDRDRVVHAKAFRRLKHKTQVFIAPEGDHYRVRLTHTLEVSQIARTAARAIGL